jgi:hypothetical protein
VWSAEPETKWLLSGEKATDSTQLVWPDSVPISVPWLLEPMLRFKNIFAKTFGEKMAIFA